jgi:ankyrin repeat protein
MEFMLLVEALRVICVAMCTSDRSMSRKKEIVKLLLDQGADVNAQGSEYGSALQAALSGGHQEIVKKLQQRGAIMLSPKRSGPLITSSPVKKSRLISSSAL